MTMEQAIAVSDLEAVRGRLTNARDRGVLWLLSQIDANGRPVGAEEANFYYRLPWALSTSGRPYEASAVLSWIERHALGPDGDLVPGPAQTPWTTESASYPLANLAMGAWHLERYATAESLMRTLEQFQDPATGGAYLERPEHRSTGRQDLLSTAQLGISALMTGHRDVAERAYRWVVALYDAQPELPRKLYLSTDPGGLVTEFTEPQAFGHVIDFEQGRQAFFNPGIGAAFLARYAVATGEDRALQIACELLELSENGTSLQYDFPDTVHVGKFAWGLAATLDALGEEQHLRSMLRISEWYAATQLEDGRWNPSRFLVPEPDAKQALWKTGEHVFIINMMLGALSRERTGRES